MAGTSNVTEINFPYVKTYRDRHQKVRYYFRRKGSASVALPSDPLSLEWKVAYLAARDGPSMASKPTSAAAGTANALLAEFYASDYWLNTLKPITHRSYRNIYGRWAEEWGSRSVKSLTRKDVQKMLDDRAATPGAARTFLKRMRMLFDFAIEREYRDDNPFRAVKLKQMATTGFAPWSDAEIEQFKDAYPSGTRERRALALLLYTTQRRSDVHRMGPEHRVADCIVITQVKGRKGAEPVQLVIPMHPALKAELDLAPAGCAAYVETAFGKPFSAAGFSHWFRDQAIAAGLASRTAHGLRKSGARHHAEAGSGAPQIAAITGHKSLKEVERYIRSASQPRLAQLAMDNLSPPKVSNPEAESV